MNNLRDNAGAVIVTGTDYISEKAIKRFNVRTKFAGILRVVFSLLILALIIGGTVADAGAHRNDDRIAAEAEV